MTPIRGARTGALLLTAAATAVAITVAMPAEAAAPAYVPGDVVMVNGIGVTAPLTEGSVALSVDRVDGTSQTLMVTTDAAGRVTVSNGTPAAPTDPNFVPPPKCSDPAFSLLGGKWPSSYNWNFRRATTPNELTKKKATQALKQSVNNITNSSNGCGLADEVSLTNNYLGSTTQASDVTSIPTCVGSPQPLNVTEFGPIGGGGILAATCTYTSGGTITNADVRINNGFEWWTGGSCSGAYGVRAVQTHEYGHAVGLGHVDEANHGNLTMSTNINSSCSDFEASLGQGDVLALRALY
jgi:hypothetical protein